MAGGTYEEYSIAKSVIQFEKLAPEFYADAKNGNIKFFIKLSSFKHSQCVWPDKTY